MGDWIHKVTSTSVSEGPSGTLGSDKTSLEMATAILINNPGKSKLSITRYMQFVINRAGVKMTQEHREKIEEAIEIVWRTELP